MKRELNLVRIQWILWIIVYALMLLYSVRSRELVATGFSSSTIILTVSLLAIYSQALWLVPQFLQKNKISHYIGLTLSVLVVLVIFRTTLDFFILNKLLGLSHFYNFSINHISFAFLTVFLSFIMGFLLRVSIDYVNLLKKQEDMVRQQAIMELHVLKSQVQPHFMFNTLNNIYSLAVKRSEKTADVVARLSDIMRYLVYEAGKETVVLQSEINFIQNYIELERIRMLHPAEVEFTVDVEGRSLLVPPMLFIPFVENLFKHGVDKTRKENRADIRLWRQHNFLHFMMKNMISNQQNRSAQPGVGLQNLRKRLDILFGNQYTLHIRQNENDFIVQLTIPLNEN